MAALIHRDVNDVLKRFLWLSAYATAMAFLEAAVVVYIRGLPQVSDGHVPLTSLGPYTRMEIWREVATIVMVVAVGWMVGRRWRDRLAFGLFAFGLWDIWYYVWQKVLVDWPNTLLDWDLLFLIPLPWWGPVLSPILIATVVCICAVLAVVRMKRGKPLGFTPARVGAVVLGGLLVMYVFMSDALHALLQGRRDWFVLRPEAFNWPLFLVAVVLMALPGLMATWPGRSWASKAR